MLEYCGTNVVPVCSTSVGSGQAESTHLCKCSFTGEKTSKLAGTSWYKSANLTKVERQWFNESTLPRKKKRFMTV